MEGRLPRHLSLLRLRDRLYFSLLDSVWAVK